MAKKPTSGILATFAPKTQDVAAAAPAATAAPAPQAMTEKKRRKQLVFLVTDEQETDSIILEPTWATSRFRLSFSKR